jgi:hypothetical protein
MGYSMDWSHQEVEAIVSDYLQMLTLELLGQSFNKSDHRRRLKTLLNGRTDASIEFKHGNISAAMIDLGYFPLRGYRARDNYQSMLAEVLVLQIRNHPLIDEAARVIADQKAVVPTLIDFSKVATTAPLKKKPPPNLTPPSFRAVKRDYLEQEARNQSLGLAGELFVLEFENRRLWQLGEKKLANRIDHVSVSKGDGLGYDILSFEPGGEERLIEVKTTAHTRETPFFVTRGELALSKTRESQFHLYRLFDFRKTPRLFELSGALDVNFLLDPVTYKASFA